MLRTGTDSKWIAPSALMSMIALPLALAFAANDEIPPVFLDSFSTHSRLSFQVDEGVEIDLDHDSSGFRLFFKGLDLADWGAPIGREQEWAGRFADGVDDERLSGIKIKESREGVVVQGNWKFPGGDEAPANPAMERFDFRQKSPPRFVLDFWPKKGPTVAEVRLEKLRERNERLRRLKAEKERKRVNRRIAREKKKRELADLKSYCARKLDDSNDVFLKFRPVHGRFDFGKWFSMTTPDANYPYLEPKGDSDESGYVRLALKLYREGKPALAIRTIEFLDKEHPKSTFRHEMRFLRANALLRLGLNQEAHRLFEELTADPKASPVALHSGMFIAGVAERNGEHIKALERFLWLVRHYPNHRLNWVFHLGAAESMYAIRQIDRASKEYEWVIRNAPGVRHKAEAAFRVGDLYMERFQYEQALAAYFRGTRYFSSSLDDFPSVKVNRAESLYWIGKYDEAEKAFKGFLAEHPGHPEGWRATLRLAEIEGRLRGDVSAPKYREYLMRTINSYPYSPGAVLARLRALPCGDQAGFDAVAMDRFFEREVKSFDGAGVVSMSGYSDLTALSHVRALTKAGRLEDAVDANASYLATSLSKAARAELSAGFNRGVRTVIMGMLEEGRRYEALAYYEKFEKSLKGKGDGLIPDFILKLAQAAGDLRLGELGLKLVARYRELVKDEDRQPATDIHDRLKQSEEDFTEAKALWVAHGAEKSDRVKALLKNVSDEGAQSGEKHVLLGLIAQEKGDLKSALSHAAKAEILLSNRPAGTRLRIRAWTADLNRRMGARAVAASLFGSIEADLGTQREPADAERAEEDVLPPGVPPLPGREGALLAQAELHEKLGKWGEAAAVYARAVESGEPDDRLLFGYARALGKTGKKDDLSKADSVLKKILEGEGDGFWKKLARDALESRR